MKLNITMNNGLVYKWSLSVSSPTTMLHYNYRFKNSANYKTQFSIAVIITEITTALCCNKICTFVQNVQGDHNKTPNVYKQLVLKVKKID